MDRKFDFKKHARLMGRFDESDPLRPAAAWVNSAVKLCFSGTGLTMRVDGQDNNGKNYVEVVIDGTARDVLQMQHGVSEYVVAKGLAAGVHTVEIQKRNDILNGTIRFEGFAVTGEGGFLDPPPEKPIKLEYFGDSITSGAGNERQHNLPEDPAKDNGYMSYVGISARLLNADYHTLSVSGCGLIQDCFGGPGEVPSKFYGVFSGDGDPWDFSKFIANGVVINLGQNDFSAPVDKQKYEDRYVLFVNQILEQYPQAFVFCCVGTMDNNYGPSVKRVVERLNAAGRERVYFTDLGLIHPEVEGWGSGRHPSVQTHYRMGVELAHFISEKTGWPLCVQPKTPIII